MAQTLVRPSRQSEGPLNFKALREELASMAGIASETVSTLSDFKNEKPIGKKGSQFHILNLNRLAKIKK